MTELAEGHINPSAIAEAGKAEGGASSKNKERSKGRKGSQRESKSGGQRKSESRGNSESQDKSSGSRAKSSGKQRQSGKGKGKGASSGGDDNDADLKSREYRDEDGAVHHHTRSYMESVTGKTAQVTAAQANVSRRMRLRLRLVLGHVKFTPSAS
jgi:hypothetical protein